MNELIGFIVFMLAWVLCCFVGRSIGAIEWALPFIMLYGYVAAIVSLELESSVKKLF